MRRAPMITWCIGPSVAMSAQPMSAKTALADAGAAPAAGTDESAVGPPQLRPTWAAGGFAPADLARDERLRCLEADRRPTQDRLRVLPSLTPDARAAGARASRGLQLSGLLKPHT